MALKKLTIEISDDLLLDLRQFCFENRLSYSDAFAEILYGFFEDSTLSADFEMSSHYKKDYDDKYWYRKK